MSRNPALAVLVLVAAACARPPVSDEVTIELSDDSDTAVVTAETRFELYPANREARARVEAARSAAQTGTDSWATRFARLTPQRERLTFARERGVLERVTRVVRIPADDLQLVFSDSNITVSVLHGDDWSELTFYPGTSVRATREQQQRFERELAAWSDGVARYFTAIDDLYRYMDRHPHRTRDLFAALIKERWDDGREPLVAEDEEPLLSAVGEAMTAIADRMDQQEGRASSFGEEADLIFNPFPARITLHVPGEVLSSEGFDVSGRKLAIEPVDLFTAIAALEGRWISPDPLAALLRDDETTSEALAARRRESRTSVNSGEIAAAIREQLVRPKTYAVRWRR